MFSASRTFPFNDCAPTDPLKFSVSLEGIKSARLARRLSVSRRNEKGERGKKNEGKPHQEEVKGDIFHCETKVPFTGQLGEHKSTLRGEKMWLSPTVFS